jgi:hypothetical protein
MRVKAFVSILLLPAFCTLNFSCLSTKTRLGTELGQISPNRQIISLTTKSGQFVDFGKEHPGRVEPASKTVVGTALQPMEVSRQDVKGTIKNDRGLIVQVIMNSGQTYQVTSYSEKGDKITFGVRVPISVPFADVQQVWVRMVNGTRTLVAVVTVIGAAVAVLYVVALASLEHSMEEGSCPFVYSWNGREFVLDAEPYGAAISEGLKRTDRIELTDLREDGGKYRILLANELNETQYTDELKLVAVDHAPGLLVAADLAGRFHTFSNPLPPARAFDQHGRDITASVAKSDRFLWLSPLDEKNPDGQGEFRDELTFEFSKPAGAKQARLLANVWTTSWGSRSAGLFLEQYGSSLPEKYAEVDAHGPMYSRLVNWMANEELAALKVWVETPGGWKSRAMIMGGAPFVTKDRACLLDVGDVPGDILRLKLRPPVNFWMVNALAVSYGEEEAIQVRELAAERAVDPSGRDVKSLLAAMDRSYLESANRGEQTELVFPAPPVPAGLERTVFVKASGYYKVHVDATGEPRTELAERILGEPGFAARYSFREYLKWEAALRAQAEKSGRR